MELPRGLGRALAAAAVVALASAGALAAGASEPATTFADVTSEAGIAFGHAGEIHDSGSSTWPAFPEIMGSGACWGDFDGDGTPDLYLVNQRYNEHNEAFGPWALREDPTDRLYLNAFDGTFADATEASGIDGRGFGYGCSAADYDGDGHLDLFVAGFGLARLYENQGGARFEDVTDESGLSAAGDCGTHACLSTSSAWADYEGDGDLDLYVGNYVDTNLTDTHRGPLGHEAQRNWLFRNDGDGTFTEVAAEAGVAGNPTDAEGSKTLGVLWFDLDLDGDLDLYVANDMVPNDLYVNRGDGTFREASNASGLADPDAGMGVTAGDYDRDGDPDLYFTHYADQHNGFYRNRGDGTFEDRSGEDELANDHPLVGWGTRFADVDLDRDLDLVVANGHTEPLVRDYEQSARVFRQDDNRDPDAAPWDANWTDVTNRSGPAARAADVSRGAAFGDYDLDGDVDVAVVDNGNQSAHLLEAEAPDRSWLLVTLEQDGPNRFGVGARVVVEADGVTQTRVLRAGSSYLSQNARALHFGLGDVAQVDRVTVHWPDGATRRYADLPVDAIVRLERGTGDVVTDTLAPRTELVLEGRQGPGGWFRSEVTASLDAADRAVGPASGVDRTELSVDGEAVPGDERPVNLSGEGRHALAWRSWDAVGNSEPVRTDEVRVDRTPPESDHALHGGSPNRWSRGPVEVHLDASDALSGVHAIRYTLDGAEEVYEGPFEVRGNGTHALEHAAVDRAGNRAPPTQLEVRVDGVAPSGNVTRPRPGGAYVDGQPAPAAGSGPALVLRTPQASGPFPARVEATDELSGVAEVTFRLDGEVQARDPSPPYEWDWDVASTGSGLHTLETAIEDRAGNTAVDRVEVLSLGPTSLP